MSIWWCVLCMFHASAVLATTESFGYVFDESAFDGDFEKISGFWYQIVELRTHGDNRIMCKDIILEEHHITQLNEICEETGSYQITRTENGNYVIQAAKHLINLKTTKDLSFLVIYREASLDSEDYIKIYGRTSQKTHQFNQLTKHLGKFKVITCTQKRTGDCPPKIEKHLTKYTNEETSSYHIKERLRTQRQARSSEKQGTNKKEDTELNDYAIQNINGTDYIVYDDIFIPLEPKNNKEAENLQQINERENIKEAEARYTDGKELGDDPNNLPINNTNSSTPEIIKSNCSVNLVENLVLINTVNNVTQVLTTSGNITNIPNEKFNQTFPNTSSGTRINSMISINDLNPNINQSTNYDVVNVTIEFDALTSDESLISATTGIPTPGLNDHTSNLPASVNYDDNALSSTRTIPSDFKNENNSDFGNDNLSTSFTSTNINSFIYTNIVTPYQKVTELNNTSLYTPGSNFSADNNVISSTNIATPSPSSYWDVINNSTPVQEIYYNYTNYVQDTETESTANPTFKNEQQWTTSSNKSLSSGTSTLSTSNLTYVTESSVLNLTNSDGISRFAKPSSTIDSNMSSNDENSSYPYSFTTKSTKVFTPSSNPYNISKDDFLQHNSNTSTTTSSSQQVNDNNANHTDFIPLAYNTSPPFAYSDNSNENTTHNNTAITGNLTISTTMDQSNITANTIPMMNTQISNPSSTENPPFTTQNLTLHVANTTQNITDPQNFNTTTTIGTPVLSYNSSILPIISNITSIVRPIKPNITNISTIKPGTHKGNSGMSNTVTGSGFILVLVIVIVVLESCTL